MRNIWEKPELIILYRAQPEEAVLGHCKHKIDTPLNPAISQDNCNHDGSDPTKPTCAACQSNANRS